MPDQPTMTPAVEQRGSHQLLSLKPPVYVNTSIPEHTFQFLSSASVYSLSYSPYCFSFYSFCPGSFFSAPTLILCLSYSVRLYSTWILILVPGICLGLGAVFWNADLWRCHHSSMSWVSTSAPQSHSLIHAAVMTCIIPHWLIWATSKLPSFGFSPPNFFSRKRSC